MRSKRAAFRAAGLFKRGEQFILHPSAQTTAGVLLSGTPVAILPSEISDAELGAAVQEALQNFKSGVPHPDPYAIERRKDPLLEALGFKSWTAFSKNTLYCSISQDREGLRLTPSRRTGAQGGYGFILDCEILLSQPVTSDQLGAAVRNALSHCE